MITLRSTNDAHYPAATLKDTICNISALKCQKNNYTYVIYLVELCTYTIPNVSNNVQTPRILLFYFNDMGRFI